MSALNYNLALHDRLWAILLDHAPAAALFKVGNRVKLNRPVPDRKPASKQPADYPELTIKPTDGTDSAFDVPETFGDLNSENLPYWEYDVTQSFEATIIHDTLELDTEAEAEFLTALRKAGRQLALPSTPDSDLAYVLTWGPITTRRTEENQGGRVRAVTRFTFPVNMQFTHAQLTT